MLYPEHIRERKKTCNCHKLGMLFHGENIVAINDGRMTRNNVMDIAAAPKNKKRMLEVTIYSQTSLIWTLGYPY